ncbi:MAG: hypothetical protein IKI62_04395 [Clostridia bacterium]|nr:hypothetical protein [Clostridia bacterium]
MLPFQAVKNTKEKTKIKKYQSNYNFTIHKKIGVVSEKPNGWTLELNIVSFNGRDAKYDLLEWRNDHTELRTGARFSESDLKPLMELIRKHLAESGNEE